MNINKLKWNHRTENHKGKKMTTIRCTLDGMKWKDRKKKKKADENHERFSILDFRCELYGVRKNDTQKGRDCMPKLLGNSLFTYILRCMSFSVVYLWWSYINPFLNFLNFLSISKYHFIRWTWCWRLFWAHAFTM